MSPAGGGATVSTRMDSMSGAPAERAGERSAAGVLSGGNPLYPKGLAGNEKFRRFFLTAPGWHNILYAYLDGTTT